jgi:PAS domain S-box-containing protein
MKPNFEKPLVMAVDSSTSEEATAFSYSFLQSLSNNLSDAVIITDQQFKVVSWNKAATQLLNIAETTAINKYLPDLLFHDSPALFKTIFQQLNDEGKWEGQLNITKNKSLHLTFLVAEPDEQGITRLVIVGKENSSGNGPFLSSQHEHTTSDDKRPENEITLSEQKLRSLLDNSIGAIFLLDSSYRIILTNEKAKKIARLASDVPELKEGTYFLDILPELRRIEVKKVLDRVLQGEKIEYEVYYPKKNSETGIWLLASYTPVRNTDDTVNQICITAYNISNLKENEAALIKSEQRWKFALDGAGDGVWEYNFQSKEVYYSPLYKNMLGYSEEEFPNRAKEWQSRVHPDDAYKIKGIDTLYEDRSIVNHSVEYRLRSKSGKYVWILDRGMLLERTPEGEPLILIGTHTNITERKLAEQRLAQSEQRFASFMANTPTMTWIIDEYAVFRYLNAAYMKAFRLTEEAIGKSVYEFFPKHICDQFVENNWKVFEANQPMELTEEGAGPDGESQVYNIFKFPLGSENGVRLLGGVALDITKKVQLEQQLAEDEARKKREIIQAIIDAQEKERTELAYELHDNVNQILSSSKLMLEVAAEKPELSEDFSKRGLSYLQEAINEIRKISHNLTPTSLRDISLEVAVHDVVQSINATGKLKIKYYKNITPGQKEIAPEKQLAVLRIIQEQFNNILKHAQASEATISLVVTDDNLFLEIQDDGCGFDIAITKKGLGLNNMFNRVEFYHGTIHFNSSNGKGCILLIEIPL